MSLSKQVKPETETSGLKKIVAASMVGTVVELSLIHI